MTKVKQFMTFATALALMTGTRTMGHRSFIAFPGFPLSIPNPQPRSEETKARKRLMRRQRRARINRRGY